MTGLTHLIIDCILELKVGVMPKDTFKNLDKKRQEKIFNAAINEFSIRRFSEASINKIIKDANIARGSFYQYFRDKEDIFDYMMNRLIIEKSVVLQNQKIDIEADFFDMFLTSTFTAIRWGKQNPKYNSIGVLITRDDSPAMKKYNTFTEKGYQHFISYIDRDKERGNISKDIDGKLLVDMLMGLSRETMLKLYLEEDADEEQLISQLKTMCNIVKKGVAI